MIPPAGSSPRLWGTQERKRCCDSTCRFIPTPVGNTRTVPHQVSLSTVHPHACGEHAFTCNGSSGDTGSSPRLWGTRRPIRLRRIRFGSSPRLWGTLLRRSQLPKNHRFIPTPVGNTLSSCHCRRNTPVHPHACGEHASLFPDISESVGSSPRLWGTLAPIYNRKYAYRFIPTPVGNTTRKRAQRVFGSVHPHACGEHIFGGGLMVPPSGSSPRLWGTLVIVMQEVVFARFIPTPVGNTSRS